MRRALAFLVPVSLLAACAPSDGEQEADAALIFQDPVIARALHDPLMSDPDLASRNEANAAIGFVDSAALPVFAASDAEVRAAREAMRIDLLERGALPDLPPASAAPGTAPLGPISGVEDLLAAAGAPASCGARLSEDFALAATLPPAAALPPRAMVVQAGGADARGCSVRIIRYLTPAPREDVLYYHYVRAKSAKLSPTLHAAPGESIAATGQGDERLAIHVRQAANGLTGVTLIYRAP